MKWSLLAACIGILSVSQVAHGQNLVTNGSFELGTYLSSTGLGPIRDSWVELAPGSTNLTGWTVDFGLLNWHQTKMGELGSARDGTKFLDLVHNMGMPSGVSQTVTTTVGQRYRLSFDMSGPGGFTPNPRQVLIDVLGVVSDYSLTTLLSPNPDAIVWEAKFYDFTAASTSTRIAFKAPSNSTGYWGPVIDNVSITAISAVPEPSTYALFGSGLVGLGVVARRRRRN